MGINEELFILWYIGHSIYYISCCLLGFNWYIQKKYNLIKNIYDLLAGFSTPNHLHVLDIEILSRIIGYKPNLTCYI